MDTIYLLPGEERCVDFRDANGVPKVRYTYCSFRGRLFNCTCCTKEEAQRGKSPRRYSFSGCSAVCERPSAQFSVRIKDIFGWSEQGYSD